MKIISIVIPTIGRINELILALSYFENQIKENNDQVELLVVDNGSTDQTQSVLMNNDQYSWLTYYRFDDQVVYFESIKRAVELASGSKVIIFGDDDIPFPHYVDSVLYLANCFPKSGLYHYNVIMGKDFGDVSLRKLRIEFDEFIEKEKLMSLEEMLYEHPVSMSFVTSVMFSKEVWERGIEKYNPKFIGYPHLYIWFTGVENNTCIYSSIPIAYGRMPFNRHYIDMWPSYFFIEIPMLMKSIDDMGITKHLYQTWINTSEYKSFPKFCNTLLMASTCKKKYKPLCGTINKYQKGIIRHFLTYLIIYLSPSFLYKFIRKIVYK